MTRPDAGLKRDAPARVLNVDDNPAGLYAKSRVLRRAGFEVLEATNGEDALRLVRNGAPSLVLCDVQLPDISGIEVCRRIRETPATQRLPVLHISATYGTESTQAISAESGADIFLVAPIEPEELITVVRTLLRLRATEIVLAESQARLRLAVEQSEIGTWDIDWPTGTAVFSPRLFELLGYSPERTTASWQLLRERVHPDDRSAFETALEDARSAHRMLQSEFRIVRADNGEQRWLAIRGNAEEASTDDKTRLLGVAIDITARKQLDARRDALLEREYEARTEAEEAARVKDQFLATLSHELRTPLSAVIGWMQLLRSGKLDSAQSTRALATIEHNARLQQQLINDMLDVSRIVTGQLRLELRNVPARALLESTLASMRPQAEAKGIRLVSVLPEGAVVCADPSRLQQVFTNLLGNAIKFSRTGSTVTLSAQRSDGCLEVGVRDEGEGIPPESLPYIFDLFRQGDGSITRGHGGLGLGLAIVRHLLDLHGGSIRATSEGLGRGATFSVSLPLAESGEATDESVELSPASSAATALRGARILIVDDDQDSRTLIQQMLLLEGAHVHVAADATEAATLFSRHRDIDVLISDIGMPGRDGYQLIGALRRDFPERALAFVAVALTGYARAEDREHALSAGFDAHVSKPFEMAALAGTIARLRHGRRQSYPSA